LIVRPISTQSTNIVKQQHARYTSQHPTKAEDGSYWEAPNSQYGYEHQHSGQHGFSSQAGYTSAAYTTTYAPASYGGYLPPPSNTSTYNRVSTNPGDYRHSSYGYNNSEMPSSTWSSPAIDHSVTAYAEPYYTHEDEDDDSGTPSSDEGSQVNIKAYV